MTPEEAKGQHGTRPTVKVRADNEQGYAVINEDDFDDKVHVKVEEQAQEQAAPSKKRSRE